MAGVGVMAIIPLVVMGLIGGAAVGAVRGTGFGWSWSSGCAERW